MYRLPSYQLLKTKIESKNFSGINKRLQNPLFIYKNLATYSSEFLPIMLFETETNNKVTVIRKSKVQNTKG